VTILLEKRDLGLIFIAVLLLNHVISDSVRSLAMDMGSPLRNVLSLALILLHWVDRVDVVIYVFRMLNRKHHFKGSFS
jgi:hypothetical protein